MRKPDKYTVYHLHTDYSLLDSCSKWEEYVDLAVAQGMNAIASSEHGKPLGWVSKKMYCDERGLKFMHGVEIYLTEQLEPKVRDNYHTVLIAKNRDGIRELNRLIGLSNREDHFYYTNRISFDEFLNISGNIIKTSACLASPLNKLQDDHPMYMKLARHYDYLEVQAHNCDEQVEFNKRLVKLARKLNKPLIAGTDTHSSSSYKAECRKLLMVRKKKSYGNEDSFDLTWKTLDELISMFKSQGALTEEEYYEAIESTNKMADSVEDFQLDRSIKYPILYGSAEEDERKYIELAWNKLEEKLRDGVIPMEQEKAFREAIAEELRVFSKLRMCGFMLSMAELVSWCKQQGMAIGTARGSVGGSRTAYVTDIIDLNPEQWHTVFSRFCNEDREEIGDIDIDVVESDRPAIFQYIMQRFGLSHTARVASFGTLAELATIEDSGGALRSIWESKHPEASKNENPWSMAKIDRIKSDFKSDPQSAKAKYPELFYYFDGMLGTKVSQSVHPAGMVISPINLDEEYGVFDKDSERCLVIDMEELHEVGAAKYDFLVLKTVQVIRDTCKYIGIPYPRTHEIDWNDQAVWDDMIKCPYAIFQMEGEYAFLSLKKYAPKSIFDMSLVTASIRPSGASYRDDLLSRKPHKNPSELIDDLLKDNNGYLVYQEDIIAFLQKVCGLSGSYADTVRRGIARKKPEILEEALPKILEGYCSRSDHPRKDAEKECGEFLQIIEDASAYMFGYNHSIAYCLLGYLCAYYRYYYPIEFVTAFLNDAANDDDIRNGTLLAKHYGIKVVPPKFGISKSDYAFDKESNTIAKGLASIKYMGTKVANSLYELSRGYKYPSFTDVLFEIDDKTDLDMRQLSILINIDFFSDFGNQRELNNIVSFWEFFKHGQAKQIRKEKVDGSYIEDIVKRRSTDLRKDGTPGANYILLDTYAIIRECEERVLSLGLKDIGIITKMKNFNDAMGYAGYVSGREEDRSTLFVKDIFPVKRRSDSKQFGYNILTQSVGSGIESRFTVFNRVYENAPIKKGDVIKCIKYTRDSKGYFTMEAYRHVPIDDEPTDEGM